jgi:transposase-like protein
MEDESCGSTRKYGAELRERATRMAVKATQDPATRAGAIKRVADQLGMHPGTLRNSVRQAEVDGGVRPDTTSDDAKRLAEPERENRALRQSNRFCARHQHFRGSGARPQTAVTVAYIDEHRERVVEGRRHGPFGTLSGSPRPRLSRRSEQGPPV